MLMAKNPQVHSLWWRKNEINIFLFYKNKIIKINDPTNRVTFIEEAQHDKG